MRSSEAGKSNAEARWDWLLEGILVHRFAAQQSANPAACSMRSMTCVVPVVIGLMLRTTVHGRPAPGRLVREVYEKLWYSVAKRVKSGQLR